jgi:hypothetical protein
VIGGAGEPDRPLQDSSRLDQAGKALEAFSARHTQGNLGIAVA